MQSDWEIHVMKADTYAADAGRERGLEDSLSRSRGLEIGLRRGLRLEVGHRLEICLSVGEVLSHRLEVRVLDGHRLVHDLGADEGRDVGGGLDDGAELGDRHEVSHDVRDSVGLDRREAVRDGRGRSREDRLSLECKLSK